MRLVFPNGNILSTVWGTGSYSENHDYTTGDIIRDYKERIEEGSETVEIMILQASDTLVRRIYRRLAPHSNDTVIGYVSIKDWLWAVNQLAKEAEMKLTSQTQYPYYCFRREGTESYLEGRFWNSQGKQLAVVAVVNQFSNEQGDWAAYIGTDAPDSYKELDTCLYVAKWGCKLSKDDAKHFFPEIKLPYRS